MHNLFFPILPFSNKLHRGFIILILLSFQDPFVAISTVWWIWKLLQIGLGQCSILMSVLSGFKLWGSLGQLWVLSWLYILSGAMKCFFKVLKHAHEAVWVILGYTQGIFSCMLSLWLINQIVIKIFQFVKYSFLEFFITLSKLLILFR